jgi:hypothetical protein
VSSAELEIARGQWADAYRRLEDSRRDRAAYDRLLRQVEAVTRELRRRIGEHFTIAELVSEYRRAEQWSRDAASQVVEKTSELEHLALVEDAAFHLYARGAVDYEP